ncbi:MAG: phosphate ABC transporter substrate-binding protein PstS [Deltaproteobacteria bacterium]|nr:phosphate ABC transporter substrate-binding protein PstS [Deltaproteobacteria bacterium]
MKNFICSLIVVAGTILTVATQASVMLNGAGATCPYPLYDKWFSDYRKVDPETQINYQSIGSGGGIRQFLEKTVDFGATDAPMTKDQMDKATSPVVHIPTVLGAVVVTYNLADVKKGLKLTPELIADIFLGKLTKWNDPKIKTLNPSAKLADESIIVVHRSDGSGTSAIFTDYLSKVSSEWQQKVGSGTSVNWPIGLGGKGNEGVSGQVKQKKGSIGYVELIYAEKNDLPYAAVKNESGSFVLPSLKSVTAAAQGSLASMPADFRTSITNAQGKESYPISGFTYLLVYQSMPNAEKAAKLVKFLKWAMRDGQKAAPSLSYSPLPEELVKKVEAKIDSIETKKVN